MARCQGAKIDKRHVVEGMTDSIIAKRDLHKTHIHLSFRATAMLMPHR